MFFHPVLLHPQHHMGLFIPWQVAIRGIKHVGKEKILNSDIVKLCNHLRRFIESDSDDPKKRFSLRMASILVYGTTLIFHTQVKYFIQDEFNVFIHMRNETIKHLHILLRSQPEKEVKVKERKKRILKPNIVETPESWAELGDLNLETAAKNFETAKVQARIDDITLREEQPRSKEQPHPQYDDFGEIGEIPLMDQEVNRENVPQSDFNLIVTADVHPEKIDAPRIEVTEPVSSIAVPEFPPEEVQYVIQPLELESVPLPAPTTVPPEETMTGIEEPARAVQQEQVGEMGITEEQFLVPQVVPQTKLVKSISNNLFIKQSSRRRRIILPPRPVVALDEILNDIHRTALLLLDFEKMPEHFMLIEVLADDEPTEPRKGSTIQSGYRSELKTPSITSETFLTPTKKRQTEERSVCENMPPAANGASLETPTKRKRMDPKIIHVESPVSLRRLPFSHVQEIMAEPPCPIMERMHEEPQPVQMMEEMPYEPIKQTVAPQKEKEDSELIQFGMDWAFRVLHVLQIKNKLSPLEICKELNERVTKRHMGRIFAALLALCKQQMVCLHSFENSNELEFAELSSQSQRIG